MRNETERAGIERWQKVKEQVVLCCARSGKRCVDGALKGTLSRADRGEKQESVVKRKRRKVMKGYGRGGFVLQNSGVESGWYGRLCCVGKDWMEEY